MLYIVSEYASQGEIFGNIHSDEAFHILLSLHATKRCGILIEPN